MRQFNVQLFFFFNADASCYENLFMNESYYKCVFNFLRFKKKRATQKKTEKSPFWQDNALFASKTKINI